MACDGESAQDVSTELARTPRRPRRRGCKKKFPMLASATLSWPLSPASWLLRRGKVLQVLAGQPQILADVRTQFA